MHRWYVIQVKSKQEDIAEDNLTNQGFESYNPMTMEKRKYKGEYVHVLTPLFPGYMFVRFNIEKDRWRSISSTRGVYRLLTATADSCLPLPKGFVEELRKKENKQGAIVEDKAFETIKEYVIGEELYINNGVFEGFSGICERIKKDKITLFLSLLNSKKRLELNQTDVSRPVKP